MSAYLNLHEKLQNTDINLFAELDSLNVWSYKDLEYVAKLHKFQPNKINRLEFLVGTFYIVTSDGKVCFRCDASLSPENIDYTQGNFHHKKCGSESKHEPFKIV